MCTSLDFAFCTGAEPYKAVQYCFVVRTVSSAIASFHNPFSSYDFRPGKVEFPMAFPNSGLSVVVQSNRTRAHLPVDWKGEEGGSMLREVWNSVSALQEMISEMGSEVVGQMYFPPAFPGESPTTATKASPPARWWAAGQKPRFCTAFKRHTPKLMSTCKFHNLP